MYQTQSADTSEVFEREEFAKLRAMLPIERIRQGLQMQSMMRRMSLCSLKQRAKDRSQTEIAQKLTQLWTHNWPPEVAPTGNEMTWIQDNSQLAKDLHRILDTLNISHYFTGGFAVLVLGDPRTTRDLDVVIDVAPDDVESLVIALQASGYYVPDLNRNILQITHQETISRADIVLATADAFERTKLTRSRPIAIPDGDTTITLPFVSPEDLILSKIRWTGDRSEKQWNDVLGIFKLQREDLDLDYLYEWGDRLGVIDLVIKAHESTL